RVHQVVAADRETVAVAGHDPDVELGVRELEARCDRRRAAVDRVEAVRLDVVRKTRRAADAGHEHRLFGHRADVGERTRDRLQHGVVAAAGAPTNLLRRGEVLRCQLRAHARSPLTALRGARTAVGASMARIFCTISAIKNGWPVTLLSCTVSMPSLSRSRLASCPMFISGTSTLSKPPQRSPKLDGRGLR